MTTEETIQQYHCMSFTATLSYIALIVLINTLFVHLPFFPIAGQAVSPMDAFIGILYIVRDFSQREVKHYVIIAMLIGGALSYFLAAREIAIASVSAFLVGELIDWAIFTFTKKPLSERILISAIVSSPIDSTVFLLLIHRLNWVALIIMTAAKIFGVFVLWSVWRYKKRKASHV